MADFDDGKDADALRTIGEVSEALSIKPHVLRYWEQQFSLLQPLKRGGGRRYYRPEDIALVEDIDRLVNVEGYTIKGAEAVLRSSGKAGRDRRAGERRSGERRVEDSQSAEGSVEKQTAPDDAAPAKLDQTAARSAEKPLDLSETIEGLKAVRDRLARAIEA